MENLFNSKFMINLQKFGQKLGQNKFLSSLQATMMSLMGVLMVGAIFQILQSVLGPTMFKVISSTSQLYTWLGIPYQFTMDALSLWVVLLLAYNYAKNLNITNPLITAMDALIAFFIIAGTLITSKSGTVSVDMTYLSSEGMFVGFLTAFIVVWIEKLCIDKNIRIKMPDVVPQFLQDGFASILPILFNVIIFLCSYAAVFVTTAGKYNVASGFMQLISAPLNALMSTPGMFVLLTFAGILWIFGIHGTLIILPIVLPSLIQAGTANAALHAAGKAVEFYPVMLFSAIGIVGGTGNTFPVVLMGLRAKSKQIKAVARAALIPGWFNINEPVTFGMPVMYNPIMAIPYILTIPVIAIFTLIGYKTGFIMPSWIVITALLPMGFGSYLSTLNWTNALWDYLMIIPAGLVWYPFFKAYDKQLTLKENATENEND